MRKALCLFLLPFLVAISLAGVTTSAQSAAPQIRAINPDRAGANTRVTIKGRNFSRVREDNIVLFGAEQATIVKAKKKKLIVTVPETLAPGRVPVTVTTDGLTSNSFEIEIVIPITPFAGRYEGRTAQGVRFDFNVVEDQSTVTSLVTSFTCAGRNCGAGGSINSDRFGEIENGRFSIEISGSNVTMKVEGFFINPIRAEGTVEFSISGRCSCQTGRLAWNAQLR
ncbi:MAG TPA: IPT/TIG domain-containing protein [Blastocatellia bacterium]|nr:IPT/TIG domain-containing protein [Blastocatellia bacterium]